MNLKYDEPLTNCAFDFYLRRYIKWYTDWNDDNGDGINDGTMQFGLELMLLLMVLGNVVLAGRVLIIISRPTLYQR